MERNNRMNYIHIEGEVANSETESDIENLLEDSDTEYIAEEPIPDNIEENHKLLTPEPKVHVEGKI